MPRPWRDLARTQRPLWRSSASQLDLLIQPGLNGIEQGPIQNGRLLTLEDFAFESDFADIEAIAQELRPVIVVTRRALLPVIISYSSFGEMPGCCISQPKYRPICDLWQRNLERARFARTLGLDRVTPSGGS